MKNLFLQNFTIFTGTLRVVSDFLKQLQNSGEQLLFR